MKVSFTNTRDSVATDVRILLAACLLAICDRPLRADEREDLFEAKIRPILVGTCLHCHGESKTSGGLRIDSREKLLQGGESGAAIVPGEPQESLLIKAIQRRDDVFAMPPAKEKALRSDQVSDFITWITAGAVWPSKVAKIELAKHWSFEPIRDVSSPVVRDKA